MEAGASAGREVEGPRAVGATHPADWKAVEATEMEDVAAAEKMTNTEAEPMVAAAV